MKLSEKKKKPVSVALAGLRREGGCCPTIRRSTLGSQSHPLGISPLESAARRCTVWTWVCNRYGWKAKLYCKALWVVIQTIKALYGYTTNHFIRLKWFAGIPVCVRASCPCSHCTWPESPQAEAEAISTGSASESRKSRLLTVVSQFTFVFFGNAASTRILIGGGGMYQCSLLSLALAGLPQHMYYSPICCTFLST